MTTKISKIMRDALAMKKQRDAKVAKEMDARQAETKALLAGVTPMVAFNKLDTLQAELARILEQTIGIAYVVAEALEPEEHKDKSGALFGLAALLERADKLITGDDFRVVHKYLGAMKKATIEA
jgi:hypothetical protein